MTRFLFSSLPLVTSYKITLFTFQKITQSGKKCFWRGDIYKNLFNTLSESLFGFDGEAHFVESGFFYFVVVAQFFIEPLTEFLRTYFASLESQVLVNRSPHQEPSQKVDLLVFESFVVFFYIEDVFEAHCENGDAKRVAWKKSDFLPDLLPVSRHFE